jgi:hypothetical protein
MHENQIEARIQELNILLSEISKFVSENEIRIFVQLTQELARLKPEARKAFLLNYANQSRLEDLEVKASQLEDRFSEKLLIDDKSNFRGFLRYFMTYFPGLYINYYQNRGDISQEQLDWTLKAFDMEIPRDSQARNSQRARAKVASREIFKLNPKEFFERFNYQPNAMEVKSCEALFAF